MDPEPSADTTTRWAWGHRGRDLEISEPVPNASMIDTEDGEILGFDLSYITLVSDRQRTSEEVVDTGRVPFTHV